MVDKEYKMRSGIVMFSFVLGLVLLQWRLVDVQLLGNRRFLNRASTQHLIRFKIKPRRGNIFDRNGNVLATSVKAPSLYIDPAIIDDDEEVADSIARILDIRKEDILRKVRKKQRRFVWIKRKITWEEKRKLEDLGLKGIGFVEEEKRVYPKKGLASHIIGFVNIDNEGMAGVELYFNSILKGQEGYVLSEKDAKGREVISLRKQKRAKKDGADIYLTIDEVVQYIVEEELDRAIKEFHPVCGSIIVLEPYTGKILALANRPTFDPNLYYKTDPDMRRDRAITDVYEPGSVFKMFVAAAALEEGEFKLGDRIFCENGSFKTPGGVLHDHSPYGYLTFAQVIEKSSNIGMAKVGMRLGEKRLYKYIRAFGFGSKTGISLPGETTGLLRDVEKWSRMSITRIPIGHEVAVSCIQIAMASGCVANGGLLMRPLIVDKIVGSSGEIIKKYNPQVLRRVVSERAIKELKKALRGVVSPYGTARRAAIPGFDVAGKTGTAQKLNPDGTYSHTDYISSFVGFLPAEKPRILIVVTLDSPRPFYYGGRVAAPVFRRIAERLIPYLGIKKIRGDR